MCNNLNMSPLSEFQARTWASLKQPEIEADPRLGKTGSLRVWEATCWEHSVFTYHSVHQIATRGKTLFFFFISIWSRSPNQRLCGLSKVFLLFKSIGQYITRHKTWCNYTGDCYYLLYSKSRPLEDMRR